MLPLLVSPSLRPTSASDFKNLLLVSSNTSQQRNSKRAKQQKSPYVGALKVCAKSETLVELYARSIVPVIMMRLRKSCVLLSK